MKKICQWAGLWIVLGVILWSVAEAADIYLKVTPSKTYSSEAAMRGASDLTRDDRDKMAYRSDDGSLWILDNESPVRWRRIGNPLTASELLELGVGSTAIGATAAGGGLGTSDSPQFTSLTLTGNLKTNGMFWGATSSVAFAAGSTVGTTPTLTALGSDFGGKLTVTTGSDSSGTGNVCTGTYNTTFPSGSFPLISPGNAASVGKFYVGTVGANTFVIANSTALSTGTAYILYWHVSGY